MTACTVICTSCGYQAAVIWRGHMDRIPGGTVTGRTVTTYAELLTYGQTLQCTVRCMTACTAVMRLRIRAGQRWWICMTGGTVCGCYLDQ